MKKIIVLAALAVVLAAGNAAAQLATQQCANCRDACVKVRETCKDQACLSNGGQNPTASSCSNVKNNAGYVRGLQACENAEGPCWDKCPCK
jgi:CDP-diacylglycerol pyrophosphatase